WLDMADPYVTYDNRYIESVWWALKRIWEKGLLYRGHKVVPYCPRCGTTLSSHEVAQGYAEMEEPSVYVRFPAEDPARVLAAFGMANSESLRCSFLVWTTTPWTLPANAALAVHPEAGYALVDTGDELLVVAEDRAAASDTIPEGAVSENPVSESKVSGKILAVARGAKFLGLRYLPPYTFCEVPVETHAHLVVAGDFVGLSEGTGIVHIAPAFGEDDARAGQDNHLPAFQPVDLQGRFTAEVAPWAGRFVKDADPLIIADIRDRGLLYRTEKVAHTYPFCWRCDTPLLYYARSSWFIRTTALKDELLAENTRINWIPEHIREGRFGDYLENLVDWAVSRERYWGTPLNVWICSACGHEHAVGSLEELEDMAIETVPPELDLHRPYIDQVLLQCPACGGTMRRTPEVVDCWFDSGSMPFAQRHYPFENQELFSATFPADFISEAIDQTRGWFYSLLAISTLLFGRTPYKNCLVLGHVLDKVGKKMSKHLGNGVDPWEILNTSGADAMRWYLYTASPPWNPTRFYPEAVKEAQRRFLDTLWNVYAFFVLYANIDGLGPEDCAGMLDAVRPEERPVLDRWILSRLQAIILEVRKTLDAYDVTGAAGRLESFVDDLSNWYLRRSRKRFWQGEMNEDKSAAYATLYEVLLDVARLAAPFLPFTSEVIYQNLAYGSESRSELDSESAPPGSVNRLPKSVHLNSFPQANQALRDTELEAKMELARRFVILGRSARNKAGIKVRQPLQKASCRVSSKEEAHWLKELSTLVLDELNIKELEVTVEDNTEALTLATALDTPLILEGLAREMVHKIQAMRKEAGLEVTDRILIGYQGDAVVHDAVQAYREFIAGETMAQEILPMPDGDYPEPGLRTEKTNLNGRKVTLQLALRV
ncbi:MAG: isoleucine--tRNA ligase, partial [Syntrophothermus sp.]